MGRGTGGFEKFFTSDPGRRRGGAAGRVCRSPRDKEDTPIPATRSRSAHLYAEALQLMPGGVNSPVRAFRAVGGEPLVFASASGPRITDVDGTDYLDLVGSWGPMILGHAHPEVVQAVQEAAARGLSFGATCEPEIRLAQQLTKMVPSLERVRLVSSGTEATMSALRAARGFTGRDKIVKFEGCYHGHADGLLVKAGSGAMTFGVPDSAGIPAGTAQDTITLPFNDLDAVRQALSQQPVAALIVEPVAGNMGLVPPNPGFLEGLRQVTQEHGTVLIFDEVMTGFRLSSAGAQKLFGITPDMTCLGKIVGGGMPVGAYGGRRDIMEKVAPAGPVYQAGTLSGNPISVAAGLATLRHLEAHPDIYERLDRIGAVLEARIAGSLARHHVQGRVQRVGSMLTVFFTEHAVSDFATAKACDTGSFGRFFSGMLQRGVYLPPSQFEAAFLNAALTDEDVETLAVAAEETLAEMGTA